MPEIKAYNCIRCNKKVELVFLSSMNTRTFSFFKDMMRSSLCRDCLCDKHIPEAADAVLAQLLN